jgi:hypothetical protein
MSQAKKSSRDEEERTDAEPLAGDAGESYEESVAKGYIGEQPNPDEDLTVDGVTPPPDHLPPDESGEGGTQKEGKR